MYIQINELDYVGQCFGPNSNSIPLWVKAAIIRWGFQQKNLFTPMGVLAIGLHTSLFHNTTFFQKWIS